MSGGEDQPCRQSTTAAHSATRPIATTSVRSPANQVGAVLTADACPGAFSVSLGGGLIDGLVSEFEFIGRCSNINNERMAAVCRPEVSAPLHGLRPDDSFVLKPLRWRCAMFTARLEHAQGHDFRPPGLVSQRGETQRRSTSSRCSGMTGFAIWSTIPAEKQRARSSAMAAAVMPMIGS